MKWLALISLVLYCQNSFAIEPSAPVRFPDPTFCPVNSDFGFYNHSGYSGTDRPCTRNAGFNCRRGCGSSQEWDVQWLPSQTISGYFTANEAEEKCQAACRTLTMYCPYATMGELPKCNGVCELVLVEDVTNGCDKNGTTLPLPGGKPINPSNEHLVDPIDPSIRIR